MSRSDKKHSGKFSQKPDNGSRGYGTRAAVGGEGVQRDKEKYDSMTPEEKRKLYKCGKDGYVTLKDIVLWPEYQCEFKKTRRRHRNANFTVKDELNRKISLYRGDITALEIDSIVNAANNSLLGGGGVDGAIHSAAGPLLKKECSTLQGCPTGDAKITSGYRLPAKRVIHTVGPMGVNADALRSAYHRCLEVMKKEQLSSVAFPCISTGIYGYPNEQAAHVALDTIRQWLEDDSYSDKVERVILCVFLKKDVEVYEELLPLYFPLSDDGKPAKKTDGEEVATTSLPGAKSTEEGKDSNNSSPVSTRLTAGGSVSGKEAETESDAKGGNTIASSADRNKHGVGKGEEPMESKEKEEEVWVKKDGEEKGKGDKRNSKGEASEKEMEEEDQENEGREPKVTSL